MQTDEKLFGILAELRDEYTKHHAHPWVVGFSGGKDSSVLLNLALTAAVEQARQGRNPMVVIAHSDVGVENPEIQRLVSGEIAKAARFAREHGVTAVVRVATPAFWDTFPVRVIGGRVQVDPKANPAGTPVTPATPTVAGGGHA